MEVEVPGGEEDGGALGVGDGGDGLFGSSLDCGPGGLRLGLIFAALEEDFALRRCWFGGRRCCGFLCGRKGGNGEHRGQHDGKAYPSG